MIPQIKTLEHIHFTIDHRLQWNGAMRVKALEACKTALGALQFKRVITSEEITAVNKKLLPALGQARRSCHRRG